MFSHQNPGIPRRAGGKLLSAGFDYLVGLCCSLQMLSSSSLKQKPLGFSGSCVNLVFPGIGLAFKQPQLYPLGSCLAVARSLGFKSNPLASSQHLDEDCLFSGGQKEDY